MQTSEQIEHIVQHKIDKANNQRTIARMKTALDDIKKGEKIDATYAFIGLLLLIPIAYFLTITFFF